ncbi:hypothetical protein K431DRAFT_245222 [Polychaeton citri CBS 116435]|uniref:peptidylprolyl isomerase n=1 Tax=Polychaeton citri CBS 116435 TaxID=1314669 RepID=A0A9P4QCB1_9PEZI|nr:hypothetical protein K431DRAFT_245222 [Polychaeton citri CBS 116435]
MAGLIPMAMYGLEVPAGDVAISSKGDIPAAFRITMAAIDPTAEPEGEDGQPPRATLKIIRQAIYEDEDDDDEDEFDVDEMDRILAEGDSDEDNSEDDEELNGGPSDPAKSKQAKKAAARKQILEALAQQDSMEVDGVNGGKGKGKMPVSDDDEESDESEDDDEEGEFDEFVICTLDPTKNYQQPIDLTIGDDERVWFKVSGTHSIFLTGNYVEPIGPQDDYDSEDDSDEDYDLEPDSDEIYSEDEEDELDDLENPRITEVDEEEEVAPKLVKAPTKADKKGKNKRAADESDEDGLDALISKSATVEPTANGDQKLSKKQLKKMKKNDGSAVAIEEKEVEVPSSNKSDKKVQFAKQLEQGPTPTKETNGADAKSKGALGVKTVQGVTIDDKKLGTGPASKAGDRIGMRYIGKLKDGKVFDSNKKGKPFSFKLGSGEVIKGWDIGVAGMSVGGERRITIPAHLAYGSKGAKPDIPPNATLVFDVKLIDLNKGK